MKLIDVSAVVIPPTRQRSTFPLASINELADSIRQLGLLHPIILRLDGDSYTLVAGHRRFLAISTIYDLGGAFKHDGSEVHPGTIPYTLFADLDPLAAEEAELEENIRREDLSWQDRSKAVARLMALRGKQSEKLGQPAPTISDIAVEVRGSAAGTYQESTRREIILARYLDDPEVAAAKTIDEGFKIVKRREETARNVELGERVGRIYNASVHKALNTDAKLWLPSCPSESFDVILTDPPYGMGAHEFGDADGLAAGAHGYADTYEDFRSLADVLIAHAFRITKPQAHLYWFCDIENFFDLRAELSQAGWSVFRTPLLWYKRTAMRAPWRLEGPQRKYEILLYAVKGKRNVTKVAGDVLDFGADDNLGHAAQKPVSLFKELLARSCRAGDSVLDPCCGSGTVFAACHELKCRATGLEVDPAAYGVAVRRIEAMKLGEAA